MSYQQYMNMGFGGPHAGNPYMINYQGQMMQPQAQNQYMQNHNKSQAMQQQVQNQHMAPPNWHTPGMSGHTAAPVAAPPPAPVVSGKRKMANDPNRPKRPTSAYFYFVQLEREEAAKRGEKITRVAEWTKAISAKWRELTDPQKIGFQQQAATDKARYFQQMAVYTGKDLNRPKRPQSAYFLWLADFRARVKDQFTENKDILRAAGEEWRKLTMVAKAPYEQKAEEERRKYEQAMKDYNVTGGAKKPRIDEPPRQIQGPSQTLPPQQLQQQHQQQISYQHTVNSLAAQQPQQQQHHMLHQMTAVHATGGAAAHASSSDEGDADEGSEDDSSGDDESD